MGEPGPAGEAPSRARGGSNIRVALSRAIEFEAANEALELVALIGRTWLDFGRLVEMDARAREALALDGGEAGLRGLALITAAPAHQSTRGVEDLTRARELLQNAGMPREAAYATVVTGVYEGELGFVDRGLELLEQAIAEFDDLGESHGAEVARENASYLRDLRGPVDLADARRIVDHTHGKRPPRCGGGATSATRSPHSTISATPRLTPVSSTRRARRALHAVRRLHQSHIGRRSLGRSRRCNRTLCGIARRLRASAAARRGSTLGDHRAGNHPARDPNRCGRRRA